jgi:MFS family permease
VPEITTNRRTWIVVLTGVGSLMAALDTLVVSTALRSISDDLGATVQQLEWTVNSYNLTFAVLLISAAALGDRFGRRRLFAAGLVLFSVASAGCALAPDVQTLIFSRAVQGAGAALLMPLGLALLSQAFPPEQRGAAIGVFSAITGLAVASGPLVGGLVINGLSWHWIFWLNVPIGAVAAPLALLKMNEAFGATPRWTVSAWYSSPAAVSPSCGRWSAATPPDGPVPRSSAPFWPGPCSPPRSPSGRPEPARPCWPRNSSGHDRSTPATQPSS